MPKDFVGQKGVKKKGKNPRAIDWIGKRIGRLVIQERHPTKPYHYLALCDCGNKKVLVPNSSHLCARSCGCAVKDNLRRQRRYNSYLYSKD